MSVLYRMPRWTPSSSRRRSCLNAEGSGRGTSRDGGREDTQWRRSHFPPQHPAVAPHTLFDAAECVLPMLGNR